MSEVSEDRSGETTQRDRDGGAKYAFKNLYWWFGEINWMM